MKTEEELGQNHLVATTTTTIANQKDTQYDILASLFFSPKIEKKVKLIYFE